MWLSNYQSVQHLKNKRALKHLRVETPVLKLKRALKGLDPTLLHTTLSSSTYPQFRSIIAHAAD